MLGGALPNWESASLQWRNKYKTSGFEQWFCKELVWGHWVGYWERSWNSKWQLKPAQMFKLHCPSHTNKEQKQTLNSLAHSKGYQLSMPPEELQKGSVCPFSIPLKWHQPITNKCTASFSISGQTCFCITCMVVHAWDKTRQPLSMHYSSTSEVVYLVFMICCLCGSNLHVWQQVLDQFRISWERIL